MEARQTVEKRIRGEFLEVTSKMKHEAPFWCHKFEKKLFSSISFFSHPKSSSFLWHQGYFQFNVSSFWPSSLHLAAVLFAYFFRGYSFPSRTWDHCFPFSLCSVRTKYHGGMYVIVIQCEKASWRYHNHVNAPASKKTPSWVFPT